MNSSSLKYAVNKGKEKITLYVSSELRELFTKLKGKNIKYGPIIDDILWDALIRKEGEPKRCSSKDLEEILKLVR